MSMLHNALDKAMWVGRTAAALFGLALVLALIFGAAAMALAAVPGDPLKLGKVNTINALTQVVGSRNGAMLRIANDSTGTRAHALNLKVAEGKAPIKVSAAAGTATNLDADRLDGEEASDFLGRTETAADADALDGKPAADYQPRVKWARVIVSGATPTVAGSRGVVGVTRVNPGIYKVKFDEDVAHTCSIIGSLNSGSATGFVKAGAGGSGDPDDTVLVETQNPNGNFVDNHFYVTALC